MKAIIRLTYGERNIIQYFDDVNCNCENILNFVEATNRQHGINTLVKNIEFLPDFSTVLDDSINNEVDNFLIRQRIFFIMVQIAMFKFTSTTYIDDVLFYDKLQLFTSESKTLYWIVGNGFSYLLPNKISFSIEALRDMIRDGASIYKIELDYTKQWIEDITNELVNNINKDGVLIC